MSSLTFATCSNPTVTPNRYENTQRKQLSPNSQQDAWLKLVAFHAESCSAESQQCLAELAENAPLFEPMDDSAQDLIERVKSAAKNNKYDPKLSPDSKNLQYSLSKMEIDYSIHPKPKCVRKLNFDDLDET